MVTSSGSDVEDRISFKPADSVTVREEYGSLQGNSGLSGVLYYISRCRTLGVTTG